MGEHNSPAFRLGLEHGAADADRRPGERRGFHPALATSWLYRRGFARAFLAARSAAALEAAERGPGESQEALS